jgi:adenine-specific DNA-methyltransferase
MNTMSSIMLTDSDIYLLCRATFGASYCFNLDDVRDPDVKYPNQKKNGKLKCNPLGKNPTDVWQFPKVTSGKDRSSDERTPHPAQFPLAVIDRIVKCSSHAGDIVLDPFIGSGTTAEAALRNGRNVIGFEISANYVEIAARRIEGYFEAQRYTNAQSEAASPLQRFG